MNKLTQSLKRKWGPLPVWAWAAITGAAIFVYRARTSLGGSASTSTTAPDVTDQTGSGAEPVTLGPGESVYDPNTGQLVGGAPDQAGTQPNVPLDPIPLAPGEQVYDPNTGQLIGNNPAPESTPGTKKHRRTKRKPKAKGHAEKHRSTITKPHAHAHKTRPRSRAKLTNPLHRKSGSGAPRGKPHSKPSPTRKPARRPATQVPRVRAHAAATPALRAHPAPARPAARPAPRPAPHPAPRPAPRASARRRHR